MVRLWYGWRWVSLNLAMGFVGLVMVVGCGCDGGLLWLVMAVASCGQC